MCYERKMSNPLGLSTSGKFRGEHGFSMCPLFRVQERGEAARSGNWRAPVAQLRVILALVQDDIKSVYLRRADAQSRQQLDARNSSVRQRTVFELISDRWNDPSFNPVAAPSTCHVDFTEEIDCSHEQVADMMEATPQKVENLLTQMRSDLLRIIRNWEQSGQGEGGRVNVPEDDILSDSDDDEGNNSRSAERFGNLQDRPAEALQNRSNFLRGKPSYLLYFWEMANNFQLLSSTLQRLDPEIGAADASSIASVSTHSRTHLRGSEDISDLASSIREFTKDRERDREEMRESQALQLREKEREREENREALAVQMNETRKQHLMDRMHHLIDERRSYRRLYAECSIKESETGKFYLETVEELQQEIEALQFQLNNAGTETPQRSNASTPSSSHGSADRQVRRRLM